MAVIWKKMAYEDDVITKALLTGKGDIIIASSIGVPAALAVGSDNQILRIATDLPNWEDLPPSAAHKDTHDPNDGTDPLDSASAAEISVVVAAGTGTSHSLARADHIHAIVHAITDNHLVTIDGSPATTEIAIWTANGLDGETPAAAAATMALDDIADPDAAVGFNGQQATDLVIHTVANAAGRPAAAVGKVCWQTDTLALYACTIAV